MKRLFTLTVLVLCYFALQCQTEHNSSKAFLAYESYAYADVVKTLKKKSKADTDEKRILAMSYWKLNELSNAKEVFSEIVKADDSTAEDVFTYANILRENQEYEAYATWMRKFSEMSPEDDRAIEFLELEKELKTLEKENDKHHVDRLKMNSLDQDFGCAYYGDKLVFSSTRKSSQMIERKWNGNQKSYLKVYSAAIDPSNELLEVEELKGVFKEKYHNGPLAFNTELDFLVITQNGKTSDSRKGHMNLQLFTAHKEGEKWKDAVPFPYNSTEYSCGQPSISHDGKWLYFVSDMPGGHGGTDIYKSEIYADGTFSEPENLGPKVNTAGNEMFPLYYSLDGILFYSSDGKMGLGGLDIYAAEVMADYSIGQILNPGKPINSHKDDFGIILDSLQIRGFISSDRAGEGVDDDDLYKISLDEPFKFDSKIIEGALVDENGNPLSNATVELMDDELGLLSTIKTDTAGMFRFTADASGIFHVLGSPAGHSDVEHTGELGLRRVTKIPDLVAHSNPEVQFNLGVFDSKDNSPIPEVDITLTDLDHTDEMADVTNTDGISTIKLETNPKLNSVGNFDLKVAKKGYLTKVISFEVIYDHAGVYDLNEYLKRELRDIKMEKVDVGIDLNSVMAINPIYFDFAKYDIREDARKELEKIIKVMNENEEIKIELRSHTDCRGNDSDNMRLSKNRAKASEEYIKSRISNPERVTSQGFGESELINKCDDGVNCSEAEHQENRRTEFIILEL